MTIILRKALLEQFPFGFVLLLPVQEQSGVLTDFIIKDVNAVLAKMIHQERTEITGRRFSDLPVRCLLNPSVLYPVLLRVAASGTFEVFTHKCPENDTQYRYSIVAQQKGTLAILVATLSSVSPLQEELEVLFNLSSDLLCITDRNGQYLLVNGAWEAVLGYPLHEITGHFSREFLHPDDLLSDNTIVAQIKSCSRVVNLQNRFRHKNGSYRQLEWAAQSDGEKIYAIARDITEKKEREKKIEYLSYHDVLTGLYNRRFFVEESQRMDTSRNLPISVIMGDLNRLKVVNDAFGHQQGDVFIQSAADAIRASCRPEDLVVRWGGDEFMIFLPKTSHQDAADIVERIHTKCKRLEVNSIAVSIAFGIGTKTEESAPMADAIREAENDMYRVKALAGERNRANIIDVVARALFERYPYEEQHAKRVGALCREIALALDFDEDTSRTIVLAGLMHDIGKVAIRLDILEKPSPLTEAEWEEVRKHPEVGCNVIGVAQDMVDIGQAILAHHERMDGTGYPHGTAWDSIPVAARIIALADSYDTMTVQGLYHAKRTKEEAIEEIRKNEGTQFDPMIAEAFIEKVLKMS